MFKYYGPQLIFLIVLFLLLELTVMPFCAVKGVRPDLFFILIAFYSFFIYPNRTPHFALLLGLVRELFSGTLFGLETLSYGISGFMLWFLVSKMERGNPYNQGALLFIFSFINLFLISVLNICLRETSLAFGEVLGKCFFVSLYTVLIAPLIFFFLRRFLRISGRDLFSRQSMR